jgi:hypothetical protein
MLSLANTLSWVIPNANRGMSRNSPFTGPLVLVFETSCRSKCHFEIGSERSHLFSNLREQRAPKIRPKLIPTFADVIRGVFAQETRRNDR